MYDVHHSSPKLVSTRVLWCFIVLFSLVGSFFGSLLLATSARATSHDVVTEPVTVTATVPDQSGPTTPLLVAPANTSFVTTNKPTFVWRASTAPTGMSHYRLSLDGNILFNTIPLTATDNSFYTLTYNPVTTEYSLTPKTGLSDGTHTWKITAVSTNNKTSDSATWSFTIDTLAPSFVITQFGDQSVTISAQDTSTIPSEPIELDDNEPLIQGTGEANSTVTVVLTIPGNPTQNFNFTLSSGGTWSLQLGILPRDVVMTLDFTITDVAGNVSVLQGVQFIINSPVIIFPPPSPSPSPSPSASPIPGVTPEPPPPSSPLPSPPPPLIEIPVLPPREIVYRGLQGLLQQLPAPLVELLQSLPEPLVETGRALAPISAAVAATAVPAFSLFAIGTQFGGNLSLNLIIRLLQALGLIPAGKPQGLVFNSQTYEPVSFALLTITNEGSTRAPVHETVVTDVEGVYSGVQLAPDTYRLSVSHQDYVFPTTKQRPAYVNVRDYYRGEPFTVTSEKEEQLFLIPVDPIADTTKGQASRRWRLLFARLTRATTTLVIPIWLVSGLLTALFPTIWNWVVFGLYSIIMGRKVWSWFKVPQVTGQVIDTHGQPVANAVVRLSLPQATELIAVVGTNQTGEFAFFVPPDTYQISVTHRDYIWQEAGTTLAFNEINATQTPQHLLVTMQPAAEIYQDLFGV